MSLETSTVVDHYQILASLGRGAMGEVYRARDTKLLRDVALKVLQGTSTDEAQWRFAQEWEVLARLNCQHLVTLYDRGEIGNKPYYVMELLDGKTLHDRIRAGALSPREVAIIGMHIANALNQFHQADCIHRDIKPTNIFLTSGGNTKLIDPGIVKRAAVVPADPNATTLPQTTWSFVLGTPGFMAPEHATGSVTPRSDVFALGVTLAFALTGRHPFGSEQARVLAGAMSPLEVHDAPSELIAIIRRCLNPDPSERFEAFELETKLHSFLNSPTSEPAMASVPPPGGPSANGFVEELPIAESVPETAARVGARERTTASSPGAIRALSPLSPATPQFDSFDLDTPPMSLGFIGRSAELTELTSLLTTTQSVSIEGFSGVGKTSLTLKLFDRWLQVGRMLPGSLFYFDCSQRNMRIRVASETLMRQLAAHFHRAGFTEAAGIISDERQTQDRRYSAVCETLARGQFFVFLDNLQDALDATRRLASAPFAELLHFVISRPFGNSRIICASNLQCSWPARLPVQTFRLGPLAITDAHALLHTLGIDDSLLVDKAVKLVGCHPQAIRWFSVLPRELGLSTQEVIADLADTTVHQATASEFNRRVDEELLSRVCHTLTSEARQFLAAATVYRRPVPFSAFRALTQAEDVDDWRQQLLDRFLLDATTREGPHSVHDLVKVFASGWLRPGSDHWRDAHRAAALWWQHRTNPYPISERGKLEEQIEAHHHLVSAGCTDEALALAKRLTPILRSVGFQSYQQGLRDETLAINRALVQVAPQDARAHLYLATTLAQRGKSARREAEAYYRSALSLDGRLGAARGGLARILQGENRTGEADEVCRQGISAEPCNGRNYITYAVLLARMKRYEQAEENFRTGVRLGPDDAWSRDRFAAFLVRRGRAAEAEMEFGIALQHQPGSVPVLENFGAFLFHEKRFREACNQLKLAVDLDPDNFLLRRTYAKYLFASQDSGHARAQLTILRECAFTNREHLAAYLKLISQHGSAEVIEADFVQAIRLEPKNNEVRRHYFLYLLRNGRIGEAEALFNAKTQSETHRFSSRGFLATHLLRVGRFDEAERLLRSAISEEPDNPFVRGRYVRLLASEFRFDEAENELRSLRELYPTSAATTKVAEYVETMRANQLNPSQNSPARLIRPPRVNMWNERMPIPARIAACRTVLATNPDDFEAHYCMGRTTLEKLKDATSAEPYLRRATQLRPNAIGARRCYGQALEKLGRWNEALAELSKVSVSLAKNPEVHNSRGNCLKELKRWSEAETAYRDAIAAAAPPLAAKYLNNLALLLSVGPDDARVDEGLELCERLSRDYPQFRWTPQTRAKLQQRRSEARRA